MALNIQTVTLTQSGTSTGSQTIELGDNFDPKCGIVVAVPVATDGIVANAAISIGYFSFRGGVVQQNYVTSLYRDNVGTSATYNRMNTDAVALLMTGTAAGTVDFQMAFTGLTTGIGADVTFNITNAHTTSNIRVAITVFGGSDVQDALAHTFAIAAGTGNQDITLSSFGNPNVAFFASTGWTNSTSVNNAGNFYTGFGVVGGSQRSVAFGAALSAATETTMQQIRNNAAFLNYDPSSAVVENVFTVASTGLPANGYRINKTVVTSGEDVNSLAIKFSSNVTITSGEGAAPVAGGLPVVQNLSVGSSTPTGLIIMHTRQATANASDTTSADAAEVGIGFVDGSGNEAWSGAWDDDGQATASVASSGQSLTKAIRFYAPSTDVLSSEADGLISGSDFQLSWNDIDATAFLYEWIAFGIASSAQTIALGLVTETDSAQAFTRDKIKTFGQISEIDTSQAFTRIHRKAFGQASEANNSQSFSTRKTKTLGQNLETDLSQSFGKRKFKVFGQASETDSSQAIRSQKARIIGQASETDSSTTWKTPAKVQIVTETDSSGAFARVKIKSIGLCLETDTSQSLSKRKVKTFGIAAETNSSQLFTRKKIRTFGQASETDSAQSISGVVAHFIGQTFEVDSSQSFARRKIKAIGQLSETDTSQTFGRKKLRVIGLTSEVDLSQSIKVPLRVNIITEINTAQNLIRVKRRTLGLPTETETAQPIAHRKIRIIGVNLETDVAQPMVSKHRRFIGLSIEIDAAFSQSRTRGGVIGQAFELDVALAISTIGVQLSYVPRELGMRIRGNDVRVSIRGARPGRMTDGPAPDGRIKSGSRGRIRGGTD